MVDERGRATAEAERRRLWGNIPPIDDFLAQLNAESSVEVKTNRMSTQLYGDHDTVMDLIKRTTRSSRERFGGVAFVCKLLPGAERVVNGYE